MKTFSALYHTPRECLMIVAVLLMAIALQCGVTFGAEPPVDLFELAPVATSSAPVDLFAVSPVSGPSSVTRDQSPGTGSILDLFACAEAIPAAGVDGDQTSRADSPSTRRSGSESVTVPETGTVARIEQATGEAVELVQPLARDDRPLFVLWSPTWCHVCERNAQLVGSGDQRVRVVVRKGKEAAFPKEVVNYANGVFPDGTENAGQQRGWPVWQYQRSDGGWGFAHHARSLDDLALIHRLKPGEPIPVSTFREALLAIKRQGPAGGNPRDTAPDS